MGAWGTGLLRTDGITAVTQVSVRGRRWWHWAAVAATMAATALIAAAADGTLGTSPSAPGRAAASSGVTHGLAPDVPLGVTPVAEVPASLPPGGVAVWAHLVAYHSPAGNADAAPPSIAIAEAHMPRGALTLADLQASVPPTVVLRPPRRAATAIDAAQAAIIARHLYGGPGEGAPLLASYTGPGRAGPSRSGAEPTDPDLLAWIVVFTAPRPVGVPLGCQAPVPGRSAPAAQAPLAGPTGGCSVGWATHDNLVIDARTGAMIAGFFTP